MKSCHIVPSLELRYGGPSRSVLGLASALAQRGDPVELLATDPGPGWTRSDGRLNTKVFRRDWPGAVCRSAGLNAYLKTTHPEVVHHHSLWLRTLHYAHKAAKRSGAAFVVSPRGMMDAWAWNHHARRKALARIFLHPGALRAVDGWHATSKEEATAIRALGFEQPLCVAPNGVAPPSPSELAAASAHWLEAVPAAATKPIALFYSRFHQKKRLLELIDCWIECGPEDWILLVAGIPEDYSPKMIDDYVLRAGNSGRVRAFDGAGRPPPYAIASLFLLPSHSENFGLAIAEALAHGVPALVTDTTPWSGLNRAGAGWCVPWQDYGAALRRATGEGADTLRRRGSIAREWVLKEYSWDRSARTLSEFYAELRPTAKRASP